MRWSEERRQLVPDGIAPGLPYVALADVDNDGLLDILAIGPSDPGWAPRSEEVGGRFWRNLGDFCFEEATSAAGLEALNWTYRKWYEFQGMKIPVQPRQLAAMAWAELREPTQTKASAPVGRAPLLGGPRLRRL